MVLRATTTWKPSFSFKCRSDFLADFAHVFQIEAAIGLTGRADTDQGYIGIKHCLLHILGGTQQTIGNRLLDDFTDILLNNRRLPGIDQVDFRLVGIDTKHRVTILCQAPGGYSTNIAQPEDTDIHIQFLSIY